MVISSLACVLACHACRRSNRGKLQRAVHSAVLARIASVSVSCRAGGVMVICFPVKVRGGCDHRLTIVRCHMPQPRGPWASVTAGRKIDLSNRPQLEQNMPIECKRQSNTASCRGALML